MVQVKLQYISLSIYNENKDEKRINTDEMVASKIIKVLLAIFISGNAV